MSEIDTELDEERRERLRARRRAERRRKRRRRARIKRALVLTGLAFVLILIISLLIFTVKALAGKKAAKISEAPVVETAGTLNAVSGIFTSDTVDLTARSEDTTEDSDSVPAASSKSAADYVISGLDTAPYLGSDDVTSTRALMVDVDSRTVIAQKGAGERISPASMTKILTLLVAAEHVTDLDDTFTITREITDYSYSNDCSAVGFGENETVTVRDLLYGTILPSGGDAAAGLAFYVSGSLDAFVQLMNEKLDALGLSGTAHFTNCVGLYDENHYCTLYDMAVILEAAVDNELCREILSAHTYTTSSTDQHPDGIQISNWFLRRIEDKEIPGEVLCAKTGYVVQSGNCAASYAVASDGHGYLCVTADAHSGWRCIYDHVAAYQHYMK